MGSMALELIVTGAMVGALYGVVAMGFILIYKASGVFNLAVGEFVMVGAYLAWSCIELFHLPVWLALIVALFLSIILGLRLISPL